MKTPAPLGHEFDDFLFAPMGEDRNGAPLSVISALARLNVDPWEEAAQLARLPFDAATRKLATLIAALPVESSARAYPGTMAHRLVALLPRSPPAAAEVHSPSAMPGKAQLRSPAVAFVLYFLIAMTVMMVGQWVMAGRDTPTQIEKGIAPVSVTAVPQDELPHYTE